MDDQADYAYDFPTMDFPKKSTEEELVERLAKAACAATEKDPDFIHSENPIWHNYTYYSKMFLAMMKALQDG